MSRAGTYIRAARDAADVLDALGDPKRANDVRNVCKSLSTARCTLRMLHRDNMELRAKLAAGRAPIARAIAGERADRARAEQSRLLEPTAAGPAAGTWCDQCQSRVAPDEGLACERRFCGRKPPRLDPGSSSDASAGRQAA